MHDNTIAELTMEDESTPTFDFGTNIFFETK